MSGRVRIFLIFIQLLAVAFKIYSQAWTADELYAANTAASCPFLSQVEKDVVLYNNLARMYPRKFIIVELQGMTETSYLRSLKQDLNRLQPLPALLVNREETDLARCWAEQSGRIGVTGHNRTGCDDFFLGGYGGENCSYGMRNGRDIIIQLLIDENISNLGHRKNCLSPQFVSVGVATAAHKVYGFCCVMDFTSQDGVSYRSNATVKPKQPGIQPKNQPQSQPTRDEVELYRLVMEYRAGLGLPSIPFSKSLTYVAQVHAKDYYSHFDEVPSGCNFHSWTSHGTWSRCDYYPDHRNAECMWSKPRELTSYRGDGFEISLAFLPPTSGVCEPFGTLEGWKKSSGHNAVIINSDKWGKHIWKAIGIGMYKGYACIWFGDEVDPAGYYDIDALAKRSEKESAYNTVAKPQPQPQSKQQTKPQPYKAAENSEKSQPATVVVQVRETDNSSGSGSADNRPQEPSAATRTKSSAGQEGKNGNSFLSRYYEHSGSKSLSYFSAGYTYSFFDGRHLVSASLLDFRIKMFGMSPLCAEMSVSPLDVRVAYKPAVRLHIPVTKWMAVTPYAGAAVDMSYLGTLVKKGYDFNKERDFYVSVTSGVSLYITAAKHVPLEIKAEYRHPVVTPSSGAFNSQGIYLAAQIYFGSVFD